MYTKLKCLRCFNSGLLTNQVTNILTEVSPFCKSSHIYSICTQSRLQDQQINQNFMPYFDIYQLL